MQIPFLDWVNCRMNLFVMRLPECAPIQNTLITFNTPFGRIRFTRMLSGLTETGNAFQHKLDTLCNGLDFSKGIVNDIVIWSKDTEESDHDRNLKKILARHKAARDELRQTTV